MTSIIKFIAGLFTGSAGSTVGGTVSTVSQLALLVAAIAPAGLWLANNKDEVFIQLTYGDLAFWGTLAAFQLLVIIRLVHRAPPPQ